MTDKGEERREWKRKGFIELPVLQGNKIKRTKTKNDYSFNKRVYNKRPVTIAERSLGE